MKMIKNFKSVNKTVCRFFIKTTPINYVEKNKCLGIVCCDSCCKHNIYVAKLIDDFVNIWECIVAGG